MFSNIIFIVNEPIPIANKIKNPFFLLEVFEILLICRKINNEVAPARKATHAEQFIPNKGLKDE